jgi:phenylpropionate dioxygenase-like ring-hydroxylating dioxygenase large terminal subunit
MTDQRSMPRPVADDRASIPTYDAVVSVEEVPVSVSPYMLESGPIPVLPSWRVPTSDYTAPSFHDLEMERLWPKTWQWACRTNDIPSAGDYVEIQVARRSVLVVRDGTGAIHAFINACRHRGTALAEGAGHRDCFVCPFHGWTYDTDGSIRYIPARWDFGYVSDDEASLKPVRVDEFDGWVFVHLDDDAAPLSDHLGETVMRHFLVHPSAPMWKRYHYGIAIPCNWKVAAEAFMELYHISRTHPTLAPYTGDLQSMYDSFGLHHRLRVVNGVSSLIGGNEFTEQEILDAALAINKAFHGDDIADEVGPALTIPEGCTARDLLAGMIRDQWTSNGVDLSNVSNSELIDTPLYMVFPNFMTFRGPGGTIGYRFLPDPDDHTACTFEVFYLVPVPAGQPLPKDTPLTMVADDARFADYPDTGALGFLIDQDVDNCRLVQKGLYGIDALNMGESIEGLIAVFHRNLREFMGVADHRS